jgi:hypothetical protein
VPAGVGGVVVELVVGVPAQHHIAEAEALFERAQELVGVQILAAQDAVAVVDTHLDVRKLALAQDAADVFRRLDRPRLHGKAPLVARSPRPSP